MANNAAATDVSNIIVAALKAAIKQHEFELAHPGRAVDDTGYPPSLCSLAAKTIVDGMKGGLAGHLDPMDAAEAAEDVTNMVCAGVQAAVTQHEVDLAHPGRAVPALGYPPSNAAEAAQVMVLLLRPQLITHLNPINPALAADDICTMAIVACTASMRQHEIDLAHPGRSAGEDGDIGSNVQAAVTPVVTVLKFQLISDLTPS